MEKVQRNNSSRIWPDKPQLFLKDALCCMGLSLNMPFGQLQSCQGSNFAVIRAMQLMHALRRLSWRADRCMCCLHIFT